jgi:hypothetical protein
VTNRFPEEVIARAAAAQATLRPLLEQLQAVRFGIIADDPEPDAARVWIERGGAATEPSAM